MTEKFNLPACNVAYGYAMTYTIMALVFDNPVVKEKFITPFSFLVCGVWLFEYVCEKKQVSPQKINDILSVVLILAVLSGAIVGIWF